MRQFSKRWKTVYFRRTGKRGAVASLDNLSLLISGNRLWRRSLRGTTIVSAKEILLNLYRDLVQPPLGPVRPVLVMPNVCLELPYPVFGGAKLNR